MFESLHPDHIQLRGNQPLSGSIPLFIFSLRKSRAALSWNCALTKSLKPYYYNIPAYMVESLTKLLNSPPYSPSNDGQWLPPVRPSWRFAMKRQLRGQSYPFVTSKDMLASDMIAEDSGRLLDELNRATAELMSMDSAAFVSNGSWRIVVSKLHLPRGCCTSEKTLYFSTGQTARRQTAHQSPGTNSPQPTSVL